MHELIPGDEDCLYVNVYTPDLSPAKKMNVLVYIHGGALMFLYGGYYGPNILLDRDIVYVNFNYRLGPLGKICRIAKNKHTFLHFCRIFKY